MTTPPPETTNSTVTAWIPLTTTAPAPYPPCWNESFTEFHVDEGPLDGNLIGFDPLLTALTIGTTYITCQADQVTRWYENRLATLVPDGILPTVTSIQPLVCPSQWSTALNTTVGNSVQITCCPSGYTADPVDRQYEANCISEFAPGQTFGYFYPNERVITTAYNVPITVAAVAIKGWNTITTATTSADSSSSSYDNSNSSGLHGGAIAGIVIGIVAAAAIIGAGIVFFLRRRRRQGRDVGETAETETKTSELDSKQYVNVPQDPGHRLDELPTSSNTPELYTDYSPRSPRGNDAEIHELQ